MEVNPRKRKEYEKYEMKQPILKRDDFVIKEKIVVELKKNFHFFKSQIDQVLYYMFAFR